MRAVGTVFAGMLLLVGLLALTVYMVHVGRVATQALHEKQMLYEKARYLAEHANITGNTIVLPEPADLIVIDPSGIPHVAENVSTVTLPWPADQSKIYVAKRGNLRVGAADPVASSMAVMASVASAPVPPSTSTSISSELTAVIDEINTTVSQLSTTVNMIASGYLDPLFTLYSDVLDPNSYRGYIYLGGYTLGPPTVQLRSPYVCIDYGLRTIRMSLMTISLPDGGSVSVVGTKSSKGSDRVYVEWWATWPNGTTVLAANITGSIAWRSFSFTVGGYTISVSGYFSWTRYTWCGEYTYIPWLYRVTIRITGERSATLYISTTDVEWPVDWFRWTGSYRYDTANELAANQVLLVDPQTLYCRQVQNYGASCVLVSSQLDKPVLTPGSASSIVYSVSSEATTSWTTCRCITVTNPGPSRYITVNFDGVWITLPPRTFSGSLFENP